MNKSFHILMADDDPDDILLVNDAFRENGHRGTLSSVVDGEDLLNYLHRHVKYQDAATKQRPDLILLDLNMPRKNGFEALKEIKANLLFKVIPVVVLTTSKGKADISASYELGASSFINKPSSFASLREVVKSIVNYWFNTVNLPL